MPFAAVTVSDADAFRQMASHMRECLERAYSADNPVGVDANGRARKITGVGWPKAELHQVPILLAPATVNDATGDGDDLDRLVNYMLAGIRSFVKHFDEKFVGAYSVVLANVVRGASTVATITAIRAEVVNMVTDWNANKAVLGVDDDLPTPAPIA